MNTNIILVLAIIDAIICAVSLFLIGVLPISTTNSIKVIVLSTFTITLIIGMILLFVLDKRDNNS